MPERVVLAADLSRVAELALDCLTPRKAWGVEKVTLAHGHAVRHGGRGSGLEDELSKANGLAGLPPKERRSFGHFFTGGVLPATEVAPARSAAVAVVEELV